MSVVDLIIIGGGPAGLFAACQLNIDKKLIILEKNESAGKKLLLSGNGHCNLTHDGPFADFFNHYGTNGNFLKTALYEFSNADLRAFFAERGLPTIVDKKGKVFPASEQARDVLNLLLKICQKNMIDIRTHEAAITVTKDGEYFKVSTDQATYVSPRLLITTGGKSYPSTGSSGDGYRFAAALGHTIIPPRPALVPVIIHDYPFAGLVGNSLADREIALYRGNRKLKVHRGDIGFTPTGLTGPGILDFSRDIKADDWLKINLINLPPEVLKAELLTLTEREGELSVKKYLKRYELPEQLVRIILEQLGLDGVTQLAHLSRELRNKLSERLCAYPLLVENLGDFNLAMATCGGVALNEVSPKTMASQRVAGLFFAGEILDIDGDTGGYNLQAAFATGYLAARALARDMQKA